MTAAAQDFTECVGYSSANMKSDRRLFVSASICAVQDPEIKGPNQESSGLRSACLIRIGL